MKRFFISAVCGLALLVSGMGSNVAQADHGCYRSHHHHDHGYSGYRGSYGYGGGYYAPRYYTPSYGYGTYYRGYAPGYSGYYGGHGGVVIGGPRGGIAIGW
jgi:hypothetical protein